MAGGGAVAEVEAVPALRHLVAGLKLVDCHFDAHQSLKSPDCCPASCFAETDKKRISIMTAILVTAQQGVYLCRGETLAFKLLLDLVGVGKSRQSSDHCFHVLLLLGAEGVEANLSSLELSLGDPETIHSFTLYM